MKLCRHKSGLAVLIHMLKAQSITVRKMRQKYCFANKVTVLDLWL